MAESLDELYGIVQRYKIIPQGLHHLYTTNDLLMIITQVENGRLSPNLVTQADGFRDKLVEVYYKDIMWQATSLQNLRDLIGKHRITLKDSTGKIYTPEMLQEQIEEVMGEGKIEITALTEICNFRELVSQLRSKERFKRK